MTQSAGSVEWSFPSAASPLSMLAFDHRASLEKGLTVQVIEELQDAGVEPAIWKVEGQETTEAALAVAAAARRHERTAELIVLGRNAPHDRLDHWLAVAAPVPGFVGFAIGRSIWFPPLHSYLQHGASADDVRRRVRETYVEHAWWYVRAGDGDLPSAPYLPTV